MVKDQDSTELLASIRVVAQGLIEAAWCGTQAAADILRAAAELQGSANRMKAILDGNFPVVYEFGNCKDCPGKQSLLCCANRLRQEITDADRNLRDWILRRRPDLTSYVTALDQLLANHRIPAPPSQAELTATLAELWRFVAQETFECNGGKCRLPTCRSCQGDEYATEAEQTIKALEQKLRQLLPALPV